VVEISDTPISFGESSKQKNWLQYYDHRSFTVALLGVSFMHIVIHWKVTEPITKLYL